MDKNTLLSRLRDFGIHTKEQYIAEAFSRNIGLLTEAEQEKLANATVAIPGMGGVGGIHLITMVRTGIGRFHIADFDTFEPANLNRQYGARIPDFGRSKLDVMKKEALSINPYLDIKEFPEGINPSNMDAFLDGVQVVLDSLDFFEFNTRRHLFNRAREKGVYVVTAGPMGFSSAMLIFSPYEGMAFDEYFNIVEGMTPRDQYLTYAIGLAPKATHIKYIDPSRVDLDSKAGPSLDIACQICSGMAATEAVRIILKKGHMKPAPYYFQFDPFLQKYRKGYLFGGNRNPIQRTKMWVINKIMLKKKSNNGRTFPPAPSIDICNENIPNEVIRFLVTMGTWAPSADNCQPWKFSWDGNTLSLLKDPDRTGFFYDINQESTFITFGAVIENIRIAATHYGFSSSTQIFPHGANHWVVARMKFEQTDVAEDPLFSSLKHRCVNRKPYREEAIPQSIIDQLEDEVVQTPGGNMVWIDDDNSKKIMKEIVFNADRVLFEDKRLHQGLFRWIRMGKNSNGKDGMSLDVLELNLFQQPAFKMISNWSIQSLLNPFGASRTAGYNSIALLKNSAAYCLLTTDRRTPNAYINGGRMMERFWIKANALDLSVQPMAGFVFLLNHLFKDGAGQFKIRHQQKIQDMDTLLKSLLGNGNRNSPVPIMFFRLGYSAHPNKRTPRRPASDVLGIES